MGAEIFFYRKQLGWSQKELAAGICTQSAISRIESGEVYPSIDVLYYISLKLNVPLNHFLKVTFDEYSHYIHETVNYIETLNRKKRYEEVLQVTKKELKQKVHVKNRWYSLFLKWNFYMSSFYMKKINHKECISYLKSLCLNNDAASKRDLQEFRIKNVIANLYAEKGEYEESYKLYRELITNLDKVELTSDYDKNILLIKILYNYAKTLYTDNHSIDAIKSIDRGIHLSIKYENVSFLGQLYYQKGLCLESIEADYQSISNFYINAFHTFKLLNRNDYIEIIIEKKHNYIKSVLSY
nr:helix-turn-helix domain-containing protein [Mesobacillus subterraneus]